MNIIGIGTDIVAIARIKAIWDRFGQKFAKRILTKSELLDLLKSRNPVAFLAKRFAAKEAVAKALGVGFRDAIFLTDIGVANDPIGRPYLLFSGGVELEIKRQSISETHLSLSDENEFALAFVIFAGDKKMP
jgi:holo-[acyl-carrier protein] synthase